MSGWRLNRNERREMMKNFENNKAQPILIAIFLMFACAIILTIFPVRDFDTFWHVANGRAMVESGTVVQEEIFSYSANGTPFANHAWLAQIIMYLSYLAMGVSGLIIYKIVLTIGIIALVYRTCRWLEASSIFSGFACFWAIFAGISRYTARPQLFSYLELAALSLLLFGYTSGKLRHRSIIFLPFLLLIWDILHGAVYGLAFLAAFLVGESIKCFLVKRGAQPSGVSKVFNGRLGWLYLWALITIAAMLLSPYGIRTYDVFWNLFREGSDYIFNMTEEFRPTPIDGFMPFWGGLLVLVALLGLRFRNTNITHICVLVPFLYLALRYNRSVAVFCIVAAPILARAATEVWAEYGQRISPRTRIVFFWVNIFLVLILTVGVKFGKFGSVSGEVSGYRWGFGLNQDYVPIGSVRFIEAVGLTGNMYNTDRYGGYLSFFLYPQRKIFHYNHPSIFKDLYSYLHNGAEREKWNHNYAIVAQAIELDMFLAEGWVPVYWEPTAIVLVRPAAQNRDIISQYGIQYFRPLMSSAKLRELARDASISPVLLREMAAYLAYREDPRVASLLGQLLVSPSISFPRNWILPYLQLATKYNYENKFIRGGLGYAYYLNKDLPEARKHFEAALALDPSLTPVRLNLAYLKLDAGETVAAEENFLQVLEREPVNVNGIYGLALSFYRQRQFQRAKKYFNKYLEIVPNGTWSGEARTFLQDLPPQNSGSGVR